MNKAVQLGPQSLGSSRDYTLTLSAPDRSSLADAFTGDETFLVQFWTGDDQAPVASSTTAVTWIEYDIDSPTLKLSVPASMIVELEPIRYYVSILINPNSDKVEVLPAGSCITFTPAPGSGSAGSVYCTFSQVRDRASWIDEIAARDPSVRGELGEQRERAFDWVNDQLVARDLQNARGSLASGVSTTLLVDWDTDSATTLQAHEAALRAALDAGGLLSPSAAVVEAATLKAIAFACDQQIGERSDKTPYQVIAADHHYRATMRLYTQGDVGVDTDADDEVDYYIRG